MLDKKLIEALDCAIELMDAEEYRSFQKRIIDFMEYEEESVTMLSVTRDSLIETMEEDGDYSDEQIEKLKTLPAQDVTNAIKAYMIEDGASEDCSFSFPRIVKSLVGEPDGLV